MTDDTGKPPMPAHGYAVVWARDTLSGTPSNQPGIPWGERNLARCYLDQRENAKKQNGQQLIAIADFIDWLVDRGHVIAKRDDVHLWAPITETDADRLAQEFLSSRPAGEPA
jgi:hypothetical protein